MHTARRTHAAFCVAATVSAALTGVSAAQSVCFTTVADATTSIRPIGDTPALWADQTGADIAFLGDWTAAGLTGIYMVPADLSAPFARMVDQNDVVPNETYMTYFRALQNPATRDGNVVFTGGNTIDADGLYWSDGTTIVTLVDAHNGFPSPYPRPSMGASGAAFVAKAGFEVPWFVEYANPTPAKVYSNGTAAPGGGTFIKTEPGIPAMGNDRMAFTALCNKPGGTAGGTYVWDSLTNQIALVANWNTTMPGTATTKFDFMFACDTDDARVVFTGKSGFIGFGGRVGVFAAPVGSTAVTKLAIDGDLAPHGGAMTNFGAVAVDGDLAVFVATFGSPLSPSGGVLVGRIGDGAPFEIVRTGDVVNGRTVLSFDFNHRALSGTSLVFRALMTDPSSPTGSSHALVVAEIDVAGGRCPVPPAPGSNDPPPPLANCATWTTPTAPDSDMPITVRGVEVIADDDIWMVGAAGFAAHFDGSAWTVTPTPTIAGMPIFLEGVSALSPNDVWACGNYVVDGVTHISSVRWDGRAWTVVPMPQPPAGRSVNDIAVAAADAVYVCGYQADATQFLCMRWDGLSWTDVSLPPQANMMNRQLWTVEAIAPDNVYAAGAMLPNGNDWEATIFHFDGATWTKVPNVPQPETNPTIYDMFAVSANDIWVCGDLFMPESGHQPLTMHFDGTAWEHVPAPSPGAGWNMLFGIAASDANHVVAAGYHYFGAVNEPIALLWNPITKTWKGVDLPMKGYSTAAWAAGALADGSLFVAGGIGYYDSTPADTYLEVFGKPAGSCDLNCDGLIDAADLAILIGEWGQASPTADLDGDGLVGGGDLAAVLGAWS
ncbi:MAG: hypothetical protein JNM94_04480 [Phycisphaerae bacterium]|nr:hypothetical protein [Phycisphaerae bacterium]